MISELHVWLVKLQRQAVGLSTLLLLVINAVLLGSLLYIVLPQYNQTVDRAEMMHRIELLTHTMSIDIVNVWQVNLAQNRRTYVGSHVLDSTDEKLIKEYVKAAGNQAFTKTLAPEVAFALMNGNTICQDVFGVKTPNPDTQRFRAASRARQICWVPITSRQGALIGYAAFIWKEMISQEELASFAARGIGLVNQ